MDWGKNRMRLLTTASFVAVSSVFAQAQQRVTGIVLDQTDLGVVGASVLEKGTTNGTITDMNGRFELEVGNNAILMISYIGYVTQEVKATRQMNIVLKEDSQALDEVVVVGYGVQKKSVVTGAISTVNSEDMITSAYTRPEQALQGKTSGVQVISSSGAPGASMMIRVRGYSSNGDAEPLYIVDGLRTDDISTLEPSNIASMEVLKDGASAAIYGAEGGNGVVLITTKSGQAGRTQIDYNFQYTIQSLGKTPDLMDAQQYLSYMKTAGLISSSTEWDGTDTDWLDETFESAPMQKHNITISGGNDKVTYLGSLSYLKQEGIVIGEQDNYRRYSGMFNGSVQATKWLKMTSSIQVNRSIRNSFNENDESRGVIANAIMMDPLTPIVYTDSDNLPSHVTNLIAAGNNLMTDENGNYYGISNYVTGECINPVVQRTLAQTNTVNSSLIGNLTLDITPFEGFIFTSKLGVRFNQSNTHTYNPEYYYNTEMYNTQASVSESDGTTLYWQWENYATYMRTFNEKHNMTVMFGTATSSQEYKSVSASGYPLLKDQESYAYLDYLSSQTGSSVGGSLTVDRKFSYFGRLNYDYDGKYLFEATVRRDAAGLSILPADQRWGTFPAVSAGWVASREDWFPESSKINMLKIRASWGQNGSLSNLGSYSYASNITSSSGGTSYQYPLADGSYVIASYPSSLGNYSLTWETSEQWDVGLDLRMFKDRLTFNVDYYRKTTKDLITENTPALEAGNSASPINGGNVLNKGLDFEIGWRDDIGDFSYSINANLSTLSNKVTYLDSSIERINGASLMQWSGATAFEVGYPIWYFRGYKTDGLTEDGDVNIVDVDGDGSITSGDYTMIGSAIPDFTYGLTLNLGYKGFDFTMFISGSVGNDILYGVRRPDRLTTNKLSIFYTDSWSETNTDARYPSIAYQASNESFWNSDMMVFDGSYMKIKQLQLGYTLPKKWVNKVTASNLRVYVSLDDFFTFTSYPGMDPETSGGGSSSVGIDKGYFPTSKKVMFGLGVSF